MGSQSVFSVLFDFGVFFLLAFDYLLQNEIGFQITSIYTYLFGNVQAFKSKEGSSKEPNF